MATLPLFHPASNTPVENFLTEMHWKEGGHWQAQWKTQLTEIVTKLVKDLQYCPEKPIADKNATYLAVQSEFSTQYNNGNEWFDKIYRGAATIAELAYPDHPPEIRLENARLTCFIMHLDDFAKDFGTLEGFQKAILMGDNTDGAFLQAFRKHLIGFYQFYDTVPANGITLAAIELINGILLEQNDAVRNMKLSDCSQSWPKYLRSTRSRHDGAQIHLRCWYMGTIR